MGEDGEKIAKLEAHVENIREGITELRANQKWAVVTILGLLAKAAFEYFQKGPHQ